MAITTFTSGQILTAAQMNAVQANDYNQTVSTKTASYTLVAADKGTRVVMNSASATTITVNTSLFNAGDTLFLQNISTGVCTVTAGTATVATAGSLAIPQNGSGILYFTSAGVSIFYPSAGASTKVGQVLQSYKTDTFSSSSTSFVDITTLSVSITPTSATSKVLVTGYVTGNAVPGQGDIMVQILRGATAIGNADAAGSRSVGYAFNNAGNGLIQANFMYLDSPSTTSATTYKIQGRLNAGAGTWYVNRTITDTDNAGYPRVTSAITVMEVIV